MKKLLIVLLLTGCAQTSFNKPVEYNNDHLPKPQLQFERELRYTPTTRLQPKIVSGETNPPAITWSEYWQNK